MILPIPSGTRDVLPDEMRELRAISARMRATFEEAGYGEVHTPALEYEEVLRRGEERAAGARYRTFDEQGEVLAMYTDGLTELRNVAREMLGEQKLGIGFARICAASPEAPMTGIGQSLVKMLEEYAGDQLPEDDRAFILASRK